MVYQLWYIIYGISKKVEKKKLAQVANNFMYGSDNISLDNMMIIFFFKFHTNNRLHNTIFYLFKYNSLTGKLISVVISMYLLSRSIMSSSII